MFRNANKSINSIDRYSIGCPSVSLGQHPILTNVAFSLEKLGQENQQKVIISVLRIRELLQFLLSRQHIPHSVGYERGSTGGLVFAHQLQDSETASAAKNQRESIWTHEFQCRKTSKLISNHLLGMVIPLQTACCFFWNGPYIQDKRIGHNNWRRRSSLHISYLDKKIQVLNIANPC